MGRGEVGGRLLEVLIRKVAQLRQLGDPLAFALDKEGPRRQPDPFRSQHHAYTLDAKRLRPNDPLLLRIFDHKAYSFFHIRERL
jgi:hypothetical protein